MKQIKTICPHCGASLHYKNYIVWVLKTPFHWFGKRLAKCSCCGRWSYMTRQAPITICVNCEYNSICRIYGGNCGKYRFIEFLRKVFG